MLPHFVWKTICLGSSSCELNDFAESARDASQFIADDRENKINTLVQRYQQVMFIRQEHKINFFTKMRKMIAHAIPFLTFSQTNGTWMTSWYVVTKLLYIGNCCLVLSLMAYLISYNDPSSAGIVEVIIASLTLQNGWRITRAFPRETLCHLNDHNVLGSRITFVSKCVIPRSVMTEQLYLGFYIWIHVLLIITVLNTIKWLVFFLSKRYKSNFIRICLLRNLERVDNNDVDEFIKKFLQNDGIFLIKLMENNTNYIFLTRFVTHLYEAFIQLKMS